MSEKIVLITGASGLLGRTVYKYFTDKSYRDQYPISANAEYNWNVLGLCNSRVRDGLRKLDLTNDDEVEKLINEFKVN
jgi:nucleoside-diphosphate-sugar epimerase